MYKYKVLFQNGWGVSGWWGTSVFRKYVVQWVGSGPVMIHRAIQLIQIFCAHKRTNERTKVIQEVLADLKRGEVISDQF